MALKDTLLKQYGFLVDEIKTLYLAKADEKTYSLKKAATAEAGYIATYQLFANDIAVGDKINIPKDFLVKSGSVETVTVADQPVQGYLVGDKYIDFVINSKDNTATDEHMYILVTDIIVQGALTKINTATGTGNVITAIKVNADGTSIDVELGITALTASDFDCITEADIQGLFA